MDTLPAPSAATAREPYGISISRLVGDYPDFIILAASEGGWRARMVGRPGNGNGYIGQELAALTLDILADKMDSMRAGVVSGVIRSERGAPSTGRKDGTPGV